MTRRSFQPTSMVWWSHLAGGGLGVFFFVFFFRQNKHLLNFGKTDEQHVRTKSKSFFLHLSLLCGFLSLFLTFHGNPILKCVPCKRENRNSPSFMRLMARWGMCLESTGWAKLKDAFSLMISMRVLGGGSLAGFISPAGWQMKAELTLGGESQRRR